MLNIQNLSTMIVTCYLHLMKLLAIKVRHAILFSNIGKRVILIGSKGRECNFNWGIKLRFYFKIFLNCRFKYVFYQFLATLLLTLLGRYGTWLAKIGEINNAAQRCEDFYSANSYLLADQTFQTQVAGKFRLQYHVNIKFQFQ